MRYDDSATLWFGDKRIQALFQALFVADFQAVARGAKRRLEDMAAPPASRLEHLRGDLEDFHSMRIDDQWWIIFRWHGGKPMTSAFSIATDGGDDV